MTRYSCRHERRLQAVKEAQALNGIAYVEVRDADEPVTALRQRTLYVRLLLAVPAAFTAANVRIDGGDRIPSVAVDWAAPATALPASLSAAERAALLAGLDDPARVLVVRTQDRGDFSRYTLRLVAGAGTEAPPAGFDPLLVEVDFSFKVECPSDFDCAPADECPPEVRTAPPIDYLVKDFQGFRRLMLDRMALLAPGWRERNPADVGVTLVEMLAYAADELSYRQDAIATEAYLGTARSRVSLRRHARLVDYRVHEGCNARTWARIRVDAPAVVLPAGTPLLTRVPDVDPRIEPNSRAHTDALAARPVVFETVEEAVLHSDLEDLSFYTWGQQNCCLPRGATSATLRGAHPALRVGDVLVLAETVSPATGTAADADPAHRWAVRLTDVRTGSDPSGGLFATPPSNAAVAVTEIAWSPADALPFPLCVSAGTGDLPTAVAWGNVVLADHGASVEAEDLEEVSARYRPALGRRPLTYAVARPAPVAFEVPFGAAVEAELAALAYGPVLQAILAEHGVAIPPATGVVRGAAPRWSVSDGVTSVRLDRVTASLRAVTALEPAALALRAEPRAAVPALALEGTVGATTLPWTPASDLLGRDGDAREFVAEAEHDGTAWLRFGDGDHGMRPDAGTEFVAHYRVGNGVAGNIGAEALAHVVTPETGVLGVDNPLPAAGGVDPESAEEIRRDAPQAFGVQERAVTAADYTEVSQRLDAVQRAAATMRWTGSWHTVFVTADAAGGRAVDAAFETRLRTHLERYRLAGYDLEVDAPHFVPVEIGLAVCAQRGHFRSQVARAVLDALSNRTLPDGRRGLFHPDNLTFGTPVTLSAVYAAVHAVPGVESVTVHTFRRHRLPETSGLDAGELPMGRLEIPRLDNDPNFPERGVLDLTMGGGT